jgi:hypothetical protein
MDFELSPDGETIIVAVAVAVVVVVVVFAEVYDDKHANNNVMKKSTCSISRYMIIDSD